MASSSLGKARLRFSTPGPKQVTVKVTSGDLVTENVIEKVINPAPVPPPALPALFGYGAGTTGGAGGDIVYVDNYKQLKAAANSDSPLIIVARQNIYGVSNSVDFGFYGKSNKSYFALRGVSFNGFGIWHQLGKENVIFRNIIFRNMPVFTSAQGKRDYITFKNLIQSWVDKCEFYPTDGTDGCVDLSEAGDLMTISNCKTVGGNLVNGIGSSVDPTTGAGKFNVTYFGNYLLNCKERQPSFALGKCHSMNNFREHTTLNYAVGYGISARAGGIVQTDNDYFKRFTGRPLQTILGIDSTGVNNYGQFSGISTSIFDNCNTNKLNGVPESTWTHDSDYDADGYRIPAADVPAKVLATAKADLTPADLGLA